MASMAVSRRDFFLRGPLFASALAAASRSPLRAAPTKLGMPGPYPGKVVEIHHPSCIASGKYQTAPIEQMMHKGMLELTGAPGWPDAWRAFVRHAAGR